MAYKQNFMKTKDQMLRYLFLDTLMQRTRFTGKINYSSFSESEIKICGLKAVCARFDRNPLSIRRLFFDVDTSRRIGKITKMLASSKRVYRCVTTQELEKLSKSVHHGGIVAIVQESEPKHVTNIDIRRWSKSKDPILILDRVGNAHNLGAISRTAAFMGVPRIIIPSDPAAARPNDAAYRISEGGLEHIEVWQAKSLAQLIRYLKQNGYEVVGAQTSGGPSIVRSSSPIALVLGNEEHGIAPDVARECTSMVSISGSNVVESLNVSVAAALLMWELFPRVSNSSERPT